MESDRLHKTLQHAYGCGVLPRDGAYLCIACPLTKKRTRNKRGTGYAKKVNFTWEIEQGTP